MAIGRRELLRLIGGTASAFVLSKGAGAGEVNPFQPTRSSLRSYQIPEWFRDAKFGIWSHWGPQSAIEDGDW
jgi:alpha-L-fucosidase